MWRIAARGVVGTACVVMGMGSDCGGETFPGATPPAPLVDDADGAELVLNPGGLLDYTDANGVTRTISVALCFVSNPNDTFNYDPYNLKDPAQASAIPAGFTCARAAGISDAGGVNAVTFDDGSTATLTIDATGPGIELHLLQSSDSAWAPYVRVDVSVTKDEGLYGLGEQFEDVEHRGTIKAMQFELWSDMESSNNEAHVPVPLLVSSEGWGLLAESYRPGVFDVAATDPNTVEMIYDQTQAEGFTFDLYGPGTGAEVIARYHQRTGMPEVPPTWAFAPLQWRNDLSGASVVYDDMAAIRANGIPTGLIWMDNPWQTDYNSMVPDPTQFPDWAQLVTDLHAQGFKTMAWSTPYLESADPDHDSYASNGWFVDAPILLNNFGDWVDLTNVDAMAAWQARVTAASDLGIEGWKLDYGEDAQVGIGVARLPDHFSDGSDERTMHHQYALYYDHAYADPYPTLSGDADASGLPQIDGTHAGFLLGRGGALAGDTVADCIWPGDLDNDLSHFTRGSGNGDGPVGGLSSAIRGGTGLAASGYPFFASDTGGYRGGRPSKETMIRWTEYSATLPIMQYGGAGEDHNPWDFTAYNDDEPSQFDQETLDDFRTYAVLHTRLFPYFWELATRARTAGLPIVQAMGLAYPQDGVHPQNEYLVGDDLLVAPVEDAGATSRSVDFPDGVWVHWWTGDEVSGPGAQTIDAPLGMGPLYQRAGSAIPMLRRTVMTLSPSDGSVDSWADDPGLLNARVVIDATGAGFTLGTGETLTADPWTDPITSRIVHLTPGTLYDGWDIEVYGGTPAVYVDGVAIPEGDDGCDECWIDEPTVTGEGWTRVVTRGSEVEIASTNGE